MGGRWTYAIKWSEKGEVIRRKARYVAQGFAQIFVWMSSFLAEVDLEQEGPVELFGDNEGANSLEEDAKQHALIMHIDVRHHHIKEKWQMGTCVVKSIRSADNLGDLFTKPLAGPTYSRLVRLLGLDRTE